MADAILTPNTPAIISRDEARSRGLRHFFTGLSCKHGHIGERYVASGDCVVCLRVPPEKRIVHVPKPCSMDECDAKAEKRGLCKRHYQRWFKHGDPTVDLRGGAGIKWLEAHKSYDGDGCLIWPFGTCGKPKASHAVGAKGYGQSWLNGKGIAAHIHMALLVYGDKRGDGLICTHTCGKGHEGCCNPRHLKWSTHKENVADMRRHGTAQIGTRHWHAKLSEDNVREIRSLRDVLTREQIAEKFGVSVPNVQHILCGRTWRHVD